MRNHPTQIEAANIGVLAGRDAHLHGHYVAGRDQYIYEGPSYPRLAYRQEINQLIAFYTQVFVGREREFDYLTKFASQSTPGYLLVEAPPALGKSALVAQLLRRHETGQWGEQAPDLVFFFIREDGKRHTPEAFCSAVNSQLLDLLDEKGGAPPDLERQRSQLLHLWAVAVEAARADRPLLLVVDGLDEMAYGDVTIGHLLPGELGAYVHVVVTSRPNPEPLAQVPLEHPLRQAAVLRLDTLKHADIAQLLRAQGRPTKDASRMARRLLEVTKGEPLLARFISQDVATGGQHLLASLERDPPVGVKDYFRRQFEQLDARATGDTAWQALGLLLVAQGPMAIEDLAGVLTLPVRQIRHAIAPVQRFLLGREQLELMHLELRAVLADQFGPTERQAYRYLVLAWCRSFAEAGWPDTTPAYVLAHYGSHLSEVGDNEVLYALLSRRWMELKADRTHSHSSFAQDVLLAIDAARTDQPPNLAQEIRGSLIYATLGSLATGLPPEILGVLAQVGQLAQAEGYAILIMDRGQRSGAFAAIALALLRRDVMDEATTQQVLSFWWSEEIYDLTIKTDKIPAKLYLMAGDHESREMVPDMDRMIELIKPKLKTEKDIHVKVSKGGKHNEALWSKELADALLWLLD